IAEMGLKALLPLGLFVVIAYATMIIFVVVVLGIVAKIFHLRYWKTMHVVMEEIAIAFSTASSEATLPRLMAKTQK
ncbi:cation:dicarboxylate symporter family transporter, partial [Agathobacter rectalis]